MEELGRRGSLLVLFGDHHTTLFDEFERLTFEIQLNRTILRGSHSAPSPGWFARPPPPAPLAQQQNRHVEAGRRPGKLSHAMWRWLGRVFGGGRGHRKEGAKLRETRACLA